ncbi:unnamed protein product [Sphagnum balticum]
MHKIQYLEAEIGRLKANSQLPASEKIRLEKEQTIETKQLREEVKRLHEKIVALTGNKQKWAPGRLQSANKTHKTAFPVTENYKGEL